MNDAPMTLGHIASILRDAGLLLETRGSGDPAVLGVAQDSRSVAAGDLFLAWKGVTRDAHAFVPVAARDGAVAAVVERAVEGVDLPQLVVSDGRLAGALAADAVLGSPWRAALLVGITGTNGKTTTALLAHHVLSAGAPTAVLGTLGLIGPDGTVRPGSEGLTTPGPVQLSRWLRDLVDEGVEIVIMEASSHALDQRRLDALRYDIAVFTNLTQDHLDYHADLEAYGAAKGRLMELLAPDGTLVVNRDETAWHRLPAAPHTLGYAIEGAAEVRASAIELGADGTRFLLEHEGRSVPVALPLVGRFNVENALAAAGVALVASRGLDEIAARLATAPQVPGRLEVVVREPATVLIDFAHTPDALDSVLSTLRPLTRGRLVVLFGAGGDRDPSKRRPMAEAVARHADRVVLTSDNPRTEDPLAILDDLEAGLGDVGFERVADRRRAIERALDLAEAGDVVVLAGKGHETYQVVGTEKRPFDERAIVRDLLAARGAA